MGFKNFVRAGKSGIIYDFFFYTGAGSTGKKSCSAKEVVLKLCEKVPKHCNYKIFFDNWFTTLELCIDLKDLGILSTATIRSNRLAGCPLKSESELKKDGRGSVSYQTDLNSGIAATRWFDNKCFQLVSTHIGVEIADISLSEDGILPQNPIKMFNVQLRLFHTIILWVELTLWICSLHYMSTDKVKKVLPTADISFRRHC